MIDVETDDGVAVVTIDRPDTRNAISLDTMGELEKALDAVAEARCLVLTGAGERAFVSGGDLKDFSGLRTEKEAASMSWRMRRICDRIAGFPAPVIAALNGHAVGGGAELAVAADIRVAAAGIRIGFTQVRLEIVPAWGGAERLARLVGPGRALLLAGTGRMLDATEAERIGLVDEVLPREEFTTGWRSLAHALSRRAAGEVKRLTRPGITQEQAVQGFSRLWTDDAHWAARSARGHD